MDLPGRRDAEALIHPAAETYRDALGQLDEWTREAHTANPGVIPCRPGCTACCHGPFDISAADVLLLREEFQALPLERRARIEGRARTLLDRIAALEPGWHAPYAISAIGEARFDALTEALADVPCPFLDETGACEAYAGRPLICRMMGLGMITPARRIIENGCPIQDQFPAYAALEPRPFDLETFELTELACLEAAQLELCGTSGGAPYETTIAAAVAGFSGS